MRPSPLIQYCHSSAFGCQCISRMAPGFSVIRAAAVVVEILNVLLSTTWIEPLRLLLTGFEAPILKVNGNGGSPPAVTACWSSDSRPGSLPRKNPRSLSGVDLDGLSGTPKI